MRDKDLEGQLDGFFSGGEDRREEDVPTPESLTADTLESLLEGTAEPIEAESIIDYMPPLPQELLAELMHQDEEAPTPEAIVPPPPRVGPPAWDAAVEQHRARALNALLMGTTAVGAVALGMMLINVIRTPALFVGYLPYFVAYAILVGLTAAPRLGQQIRITFLSALAYIVGIFVLLRNGPISTGGLYLLAGAWLFSIAGKRGRGIAAAVLSTIIYIWFVVAYQQGWIEPIAGADLSQTGSLLALASVFAAVTISLGLTGSSLSSTLTEALRTAEEKRTQASLEQELAEEHADELAATNADLQQRTIQLETAFQVSQHIVSQLDPKGVMQQAADLIREEFSLYHVGIFMLDETGRWAVLQAGSMDIGRQMVEESYRLAIESNTPIGQSLINSQALVALDVGDMAVRFNNPLLPETRSEIVLPLRSQGLVIGALDLHSSKGQAFSRNDIPVFQVVADHITTAISTAQAFADLRERLDELEESQQRVKRDQWRGMAAAEGMATYERTQPDIAVIQDLLPSDATQSLVRGEKVIRSADEEDRNSSLMVPITLRGEVIGTLGLSEVEGEREWTSDEISLIESIADQMAVAIENARLLEQTRQRAEHERVIGEIGAQVRASLDPDTILKTTVRELSRALGAERAVIEISGSSVGGTGPLGEEEVS